jgi:hypothetical protein
MPQLRTLIVPYQTALRAVSPNSSIVFSMLIYVLQTISDSPSLKDKSLAKTDTKKEDPSDLLFLGEWLAQWRRRMNLQTN